MHYFVLSPTILPGKEYCPCVIGKGIKELGCRNRDSKMIRKHGAHKWEDFLGEKERAPSHQKVPFHLKLLSETSRTGAVQLLCLPFPFTVVTMNRLHLPLYGCQ
jgi:hypothetical protein